MTTSMTPMPMAMVSAVPVLGSGEPPDGTGGSVELGVAADPSTKAYPSARLPMPLRVMPSNRSSPDIPGDEPGAALVHAHPRPATSVEPTPIAVEAEPLPEQSAPARGRRVEAGKTGRSKAETTALVAAFMAATRGVAVGVCAGVEPVGEVGQPVPQAGHRAAVGGDGVSRRRSAQTRVPVAHGTSSPATSSCGRTVRPCWSTWA